MSDFSADWLALREPFDVTARSLGLAQAMAAMLPRDEPVRVLDLATGTGSNLRYLVEHLPVRQSWLLADHDPLLLAQAPNELTSWAVSRGYEISRHPDEMLVRGERLMCRVEMRWIDLQEIEDADVFAGRHLVTASALLDLVSDRWLRALAVRCRRERSAALFALSYDGRVNCVPTEPEDDTIRALVNRHQQTDKGFGVAQGPGAIACAESYFASLGYEVRREPSDWAIPPSATRLQRRLIDGWAQAAVAIAPDESASIERWRTRRLAHVDANRSKLTVGHEDLAAWLP